MKELKSKYHVVFLGESGFPDGLATIQRITLMAKSLLQYGTKATVLGRKGVWNAKKPKKFGHKGSYEGVHYIYTSGSPYRPKGFIKRNIQKLKGIYGEYNYLKKLRRNDELDLVVVSDMKVVHIIRYILYGYNLEVPVVTNFVEMASSMKHKAKLSKKINNYLHDKFIIRLFDGALPISDKLTNFYKTISPGKPCMKLPVLCDFKRFEIDKKESEPYFLYCGSIKYSEVRDFVVESFKKVYQQNDIRLFMIVSGGSTSDNEQLQQDIDSVFEKGQVKIFSNIPYRQLVELYINAKALLIPLRNTMQDKARFPHKIGEYLASANPILTTNVGEIKNYFEDGKTALIADTFSKEEFAEKMTYVLNSHGEAKKIGLAGRQLGLKEFDYRAHSKRLQNFISQMNEKKSK